MVIFFIAGSQNLFAHGSVVAGNDCRLQIGPYYMLFAGYQPENSQEEFCDDIPETGKSIIVLDFYDDALRDFEFELRVLNDDRNLGVDATLEDLGTPEEIEKSTIYHTEPKKYNSGSIVFKNTYTEKGWYIGVLTAKRASDGMELVSVFPFSVGFMQLPLWYLYVLATVLVLLYISYLVFRKSKNND
jgi:hypothetical protein